LTIARFIIVHFVAEKTVVGSYTIMNRQFYGRIN